MNANGVRFDGLVPERDRAPVRLGRHLGCRSQHRRQGLEHRIRDSFQNAVVRSHERHLAYEFPTHGGPVQREQRLGLAQPADRPEHHGRGQGFRKPRARRRPRSRAVAEHRTLQGFRGLQHRLQDQALARRFLQAHAFVERIVDAQHGLLRNRGGQSSSQPHAVQFVLPRKTRLLLAGPRYLSIRPCRRQRLGQNRAHQHRNEPSIARERPALLLEPLGTQRRRR